LRIAFAAAVVCAASLAEAAEVRGKVTNIIGGGPLGRVEVSVLSAHHTTVSADDGTFSIKNLAPGSYDLRFSAVGFRLVVTPLSIAADTDVKEFDVSLAPDNFRRTDQVEVRGDVFQNADPAPVTELNLNSSEIKEAATVLADDPFRAIQALPGVSAAGNNELYAEFSVMGAPFADVGIYLDDVLIPPPLHNVPSQQDGASLSLLTSETVQEVKLLPVSYPEKFGNQTGAAVDIHTREGSRTRPMFRAAPGIADSEFLGEGALGRSQRGAWLASFRKSYIGWLVRDRVGSGFNDASFYDGDLKLNYDVAPGQALSLYSLAGHTNLELTGASSSGFERGATDFYFTRAGWRWSLSPHLLLDSRAAFIRQPVSSTYAGDNKQDHAYQEWSGGTNVDWSWANNHLFEGGWTLRRLSDSFVVGSLQSNGSIVYATQTPVNLKPDAFVQQSSSFFGNRLHVLAGVRYDAEAGFPPHRFSPQVSTSVQLVGDTRLELGYARYLQFDFPPVQALPQPFCFGGSQAWSESSHYTAAIETRVGENSRFRVQAFDRNNTDLAHTSPPICPSSFPFGMQTSGHDYSRGVQFIAQRRSANRLSGWMGYTLVFARENQTYFNPVTHVFALSPYFSTGEDQRNSLNAFATYRLRPSVNMSGKFMYGSGFPIVSGLELQPDGTYTPAPVVRLDPYLRADFRVVKSWSFVHRQLTLYGEILNLTNHANRIVTSQVFLPNGGLTTTTAEALPITPTAGLAFEF